MTSARLSRVLSGDQGTLGFFSTDGFSAVTLEPPDRGNAPNLSRIPAGAYECRIRRSPRFGRVYEVREVPGRSFILIHSGNLAGDREKGFLTHSSGCILMGGYPGRLHGQRAVLVSRPTLAAFARHMGEAPFLLEITEVSR